jgi:putative ABC transport system permease protein
VTVLQDLRYALRSIRNNPGFTAAAVLTLALGIGANTAMFSLLDQVVLRKLPVRDPDTLVVLDGPGPYRGASHQHSSFSTPFSYPMYKDLRDEATTVSGMLARLPTGVTLGVGQTTRIANAEIVSGNYFDLLGLEPAAGRLLHASDDQTRLAHPVVVLGWAAFQRDFGANPSAVGQTVLVNAQPMTIIGVAPKNFRSVQVGFVPDVYVPMAMKPLLTPGWDALDDRRTRWLDIVARLKPGVSIEQALTELDLIYRRIVDREVSEMTDISEASAARMRSKHLLLHPGGRGRSDLRGDFSKRLAAVAALVLLVLLVACANLANLLAAKTAGRQRELAVKTALGAPRGRLARDLLLQSALLALAGGALGLLLAETLLGAAIRVLPFDRVADAFSARTDLRVLGFAFAASALSGLLFGLVPALEIFGSDLSPRLREESGGAVGGRRSARWRRALVVGQVALSVVVLASAGLFMRSLQRLQRIDPGFEVRNVVTFAVSPELSGYSQERSLEFFERLEERLRGLPGVEGVAMLDNGLLADSDSSSSVRVEGYEAAEGEDMNFRFYEVSPGYFDALRVRVLAGRTFQPSDQAGTPLVAVINEVAARKYFPKGDAVGRRFARRRDEDKWIEIVGVVRDGPMSSLTEPTPRGVYVPVAQDYASGGMNFYVRGANLGPVVPAISGVVRELDPLVPVVDLRTLEGQAEISLFTERMAARLSTAFAVLATFLAALGLYGVVALAVTGRRRELGVRMALGADPRSVARLVVRDGLRPVGWGLLIGLAAAIPAAFLLKSLLYEVQPLDIPTLLAVPLLLAAAALAACWFPARRASRIDPMTALRSE